MDFVPISGFPKGNWRLDWQNEVRMNVQKRYDSKAVHNER